MQSPGVKPFSMEESLQEIERQVEIAITSVKKMEKYDGIWHPNAKKGVSLPFTDAVVIALHAILGTARQIRSNIEETRKETDAECRTLRHLTKGDDK